MLTLKIVKIFVLIKLDIFPGGINSPLSPDALERLIEENLKKIKDNELLKKGEILF